MMNRRTFIKTAIGAGACLWLPSTALAAHMHIGRRKRFRGKENRRSPKDWKEWDESSEFTLADDDTFVCMMENSVEGGDETGQGGGLTGADLVLTQHGDVAGATGAPSYRDLDGNDDYFEGTATLGRLITGEEFTIIVKLRVNSIGGNLQTIFLFGSGSSQNYINDPNAMYHGVRIDVMGTSGTLRLTAGDWDSEWPIREETTDALPTTQDVYVVVWNDGSNNVRAGFSTTKPTKWSDFDTTKRIDSGELSISAEDADIQSALYSGGTINPLDAWLYYTIVSRTCLIDNTT